MPAAKKRLKNRLQNQWTTVCLELEDIYHLERVCVCVCVIKFWTGKKRAKALGTCGYLKYFYNETCCLLTFIDFG